MPLRLSRGAEGEFLVGAGQVESYVGTSPHERNVIIKFPDVTAERNWYHSEDYAEVKALRNLASLGV